MSLEEKTAKLLTDQALTVSVAESCSGGLLSHRLTSIAGSSTYFKLGVITYHDEAKIKLLKIGRQTLKKHGAVSEPVAEAMAKGVQKILKTDIGIGITGIAGPGGGSKQKPVGLTYIAIVKGKETVCLKCLFKGRRSSIKSQAATLALKLLLEFIT